MKILFSPAGLTDPILNNTDGPWLHICRQVQPDICYLFLTKDLCGYTDKYGRALQLMNEWLISNGKRSTPMICHYLEHTEITQPHLYDIYYDYFETILNQIHSDYPDAEIYVNGGSGTPAMKSCLDVLYHYLPYPIILCRVENSKEAAKDEHDKGKKDRVNMALYDPDTEWELNMDNLPEQKNRMHIQNKETLTPHGKRIGLMQVKKQVESFDYVAAKLLLSDLCDCKSEDELRLIDALDGAVARTQLDLKTAIKKLKDSGFDDICRQIRDENSDLYRAQESILNMMVYNVRCEYSNTLRLLTPTLYMLCLYTLNKKGIDVKGNWLSDYKGKMMIDPEKVKNSHDGKNLNNIVFSKKLSKGETPQPMYPDTKVLIPVIEYVSDIARNAADKNICDLLNKLRSIEENARNYAAHELFPITEKWICSNAGVSPDDIPDALSKLCRLLDSSGSIGKDLFSCYHKMNEHIVSLLEKI